MPTLFQKILKTGTITEPLASGDGEVSDIVRTIDARAKRPFGRALVIREVDAGSAMAVRSTSPGCTVRS